jgi:hypothetical protein
MFETDCVLYKVRHGMTKRLNRQTHDTKRFASRVGLPATLHRHISPFAQLNPAKRQEQLRFSVSNLAYNLFFCINSLAYLLAPTMTRCREATMLMR